MNSSSQPVTGIVFGFELEILVQPTPQSPNNPTLGLEKLRELMSLAPDKKITEKEIRAEHFGFTKIYPAESKEIAEWLGKQYKIYRGNRTDIADMKTAWTDVPKQSRVFEMWQVTSDSSVEPGRESIGKPGISGLEIISPVMKMDFTKDSYSKIKEQIENLFNFLTVHCRCLVEVNSTCSTHIHVSCKGAQKWTFEDARRVAMSSFYWEPLVDAMLPGDRVSSQYAQRYTQAQRVNGLQGWIKGLYDAKTVQDLVNFVNPEDRYWGWNFNNLLLMGQNEPTKAKERKIGTVEFRRPPGSETADDVLKWVRFTTRFVWQSIEVGSKEYLQKLQVQPTKSDFTKFMDVDAGTLPPESRAGGGNQFQNAGGQSQPQTRQRINREDPTGIASNIEEAVLDGKLK